MMEDLGPVASLRGIPVDASCQSDDFTALFRIVSRDERGLYDAYAGGNIKTDTMSAKYPRLISVAGIAHVRPIASLHT